MGPSAEPIIAGSRGFALALLAPLTEKIGTRPRIAADPVAAGAFCGAGGALVVVEYLGADTLRGVQELMGAARDVRVVVAVPEKHAAADASLRALGAEVARWTGTADAIVAAVGRRRAADPLPPRPPASAVAPAAGPAGPAAATPVATPIAAIPTAPPPAVVPPPAPPPPAPIAASAPQARRLGAATPPAVQRAKVPVAVAPAAAPAPQVFPAPVAAPPSAAPPVVAAPPRPIAAAPSVPQATWRPTPPGAVAARATVVAPVPWPASMPGQDEAARELRNALAEGDPSGATIPGMADVLSSLSDVERDVLAGSPTSIEPGPIRDAAVMRVRVAAALATVPPEGSEVDTAAVSALLAEIDGLLSEVGAAAAGAPPDAQQSLEAVRNALVREAIDFSEAVQRVTPAGAAQPAAAPRPSPAASKARLISIETTPAAPEPRHIGRWIVLAVVLVLAGAFHGWRWYERQQRRAALAVGLPAGLTQLPAPGGARIVLPATTAGIPDAAELAKLKAAEEAKGNVVRESGGILFIERRRPEPPRAPPAPPPPTP